MKRFRSRSNLFRVTKAVNRLVESQEGKQQYLKLLIVGFKLFRLKTKGNQQEKQKGNGRG